MAEVTSLDQAQEDAAASGGAGNGITPPENRALITTLAIQDPPAPIAYQFLRVGPELSAEIEELNVDDNPLVPYDPDQKKIIEDSIPLLRNLSPFVIQVEPPLVFKDTGWKSGPGIDTYALANGLRPSYQDARNTLSQINFFSNMAINAGSPEEFLITSGGGYTIQLNGSISTLDQTIGIGNQAPALPDYMTMLDQALQLATIMKIPPLVLLINPTSLRIQVTKVQQYQDRSRYGYILHTWGDDQLKVSITARCGAFITAGRGLHVAGRRDSRAWQNLSNLIRFYRNNGYIYDTVGKSNANLHVGSLSIRYDNWIYYGTMDSCSFEFNETNQLGGMEFSLEFTANSRVDTCPQNYMVMPMRSPIPSITDLRYAGAGAEQVGRPGTYSFGLFGADVSPPSRESGMSETPPASQSATPFNTVPDASTIEMAIGVAYQPIGDHAWADPDAKTSPGENAVTQGAVDQARPFGF